MKKLFFPVVLAVTVLLGGVLAFAMWKAKPQTSQAFYESGKKYFDEKKYPEAIIQFLNAIRKDSRNRDARYQLALSYVAQQDLTNAVGHLRALLELYPDDIPASLQLGAIYLTGGRSNPDLFRMAREIAEKILAGDAQHVGALILSGNASAGLQDFRTSVDFFERALSADPQNLAAFISLGTSQALQKNYREAEQAFLKAREVSPKDKAVLVSLANYYRAIKENAKAEAVFKDAYSQYPTDKTIYIQVVDFYNGTGRSDEAEKILREVQSKMPDSPEPSIFLVDLMIARNRQEEARTFLIELKQKFPKSLDVATKVAMSFLQDQPDRARAEIDQLIKELPDNPIGYVLLGELQFSAGQYAEAEATLGKPPAVDASYPQVHFFLGNMALRKGQVDQAMFHYQKSLAVNSRYVPSRVALGEIFLSKNKITDAREEIRKALEVRPDFVPARLIKATLDNVDKNYNAAEQELTSLAKQLPDNALVYRQMAVYYDSRGRTADAESNFVRAHELRPEAPELLRDLVFFYMRQKQADKAIQRITAVADDKKTAFHHELLGVVLSRSGKLPDAEQAFKKALEKEPARLSAHAFLVADFMRAGKEDDALKQLDEMIKRNPGNNDALSMKGQIYQGQGKLAEAKEQYSQALKANPNMDLAANNLAWILAEDGSDLNAALGYAQSARKRQPNSPEVADTLGWVYYKLGNNVLAREQLRFAVSKQPDNAVFQYHLGLIYKQNKQIDEAQAALKKAVESKQQFKEKSHAQAELQALLTAK